MSLVHCGGKVVRLSQALERFAPGTLMRGREQDTVDVENSRGQCAAVGPGAHGFADDHHGRTLLPISAKSSRHPKLIAWEPEFDVPRPVLEREPHRCFQRRSPI